MQPKRVRQNCVKEPKTMVTPASLFFLDARLTSLNTDLSQDGI